MATDLGLICVPDNRTQQSSKLLKKG